MKTLSSARTRRTSASSGTGVADAVGGALVVGVGVGLVVGVDVGVIVGLAVGLSVGVAVGVGVVRFFVRALEGCAASTKATAHARDKMATDFRTTPPPYFLIPSFSSEKHAHPNFGREVGGLRGLPRYLHRDMPEAIEVRTRDGRALAATVAGPDNAMPLVFHHGTPASGLDHERFTKAVTDRGLRMVMYSRPGYASSTTRHGRTVADCADDVSSILDAIDADRFVTIGWSGGGPHALACSALLEERCAAASTIAGVAPYGVDGLDFLAGMAEENVEEFGAALQGEDTLVGFLSAFGAAFKNVQATDIVEAFGGLLPDVDKEHMTPEFAEYLARSIREGLAAGIDGWRDDDLAFTRDWGFSLSDVGRVAVWQGSEDKMVPFAHGRWLARAIPHAEANLLDGEGHLSIASGRFGEIVDALVALV